MVTAKTNYELPKNNNYVLNVLVFGSNIYFFEHNKIIYFFLLIILTLQPLGPAAPLVNSHSTSPSYTPDRKCPVLRSVCLMASGKDTKLKTVFPKQ